MKIKKYLLILILILINSHFFANEIAFEIEPQFGFLNGTIYENVWNVNSSIKGKNIIYTPTTKLSRLDWKITNCPYFGFNENFLINQKWDFGLNTKFNVKNMSVGTMEDYDWLIEANPTHLTNYSYSTNNIDNYYNIKFNAGYIFSFKNTFFDFKFKPYIGYLFENILLVAYGGYRTYEKENWEQISWNDDLKVISYSQTINAPFIGIYFNTIINNIFFINLNASGHYIYKLLGIDKHYLRTTKFKDEIINTFMLDINGTLGFKFNRNNKLGINVNFNYIPNSTGLTYSCNSFDGNFNSIHDRNILGGTERFLWTYGFIYTISLFNN